MATKPIKFLELHYTMTQFLIIYVVLYLYFLQEMISLSILPCTSAQAETKPTKINLAHQKVNKVRHWMIKQWLTRAPFPQVIQRFVIFCNSLGTMLQQWRSVARFYSALCVICFGYYRDVHAAHKISGYPKWIPGRAPSLFAIHMTFVRSLHSFIRRYEMLLDPLILRTKNLNKPRGLLY